MITRMMEEASHPRQLTFEAGEGSEDGSICDMKYYTRTTRTMLRYNSGRNNDQQYNKKNAPRQQRNKDYKDKR
jgi:hypothetical protein